MNNTLKVVIIDDDHENVSNFIDHYKSSSLINIVNQFDDGKVAMNYLNNNYKDVDLIIMDRILPGVDGLVLLDELIEKGIEKKVIICSSFKDNYILQIASRYNIIGYLMKPYNFVSFDKLFEQVYEQKEINIDMNVEKMISDMLHNLGIPSHIRGYKYIRDGVSLLYNDNTISLITKEIYPTIALKYETTPSRVERSIRHAIEVSCIRGDISLMEEIFGYSVSSDKAKPTNSEFLSTLADRLRIQSYV